MKIKKDIRDLDKFIDGIEKEVVDYFDGHAREAVKIQQQKANYLNHTWNLRSSIGYVVTYAGKEKVRFSGDQNAIYWDARDSANKMLDKADKPNTGVVLDVGMFYAPFVSSKGYDVIDSAVLYLRKVLTEK